MLDDPSRVNAHVIRHHITCQTDAPSARAFTQIVIGGFAPNVIGNVVIQERISAGNSIGVAHHLLDLLRRTGTFPQTNKPQSVEAPPSEGVEFLVWALV